MRAGSCTVQQALAPEAGSLLKQAVSLARRRGHAQVTPLHVANTMLSSSSSLLRSACLRSHSHPVLQCRALELCFNVALNRLPASTPMLGHHHPSLSNALVAAFKRAQAHQRRGCIDTQQQPLLAVKIELEQLIISILDDPSVSRVMREAGFSSTQVKNNVEQALPLEISPPTTPNPSSSKPNQVRNEDVMSVVDSLVSRRKRSIVVVGESLETSEAVVRGVMDRVDKGEVPQALRNLQFITLSLFSFRAMSRDEVDQKVGELRCLVKSCCERRSGAVLYLGDLKWVAEYRLRCEEKGRKCYCPVEHVIMEIRSLVGGGIGGDQVGGGKFWVIGFATYRTYMRCRIGNPSLEDLWVLQPLAIPAGSLELSLNCDSESSSLFKSKRNGDELCWPLLEDGVRNQLDCYSDCSVKFETKARGLPNISSSRNGSITSSLPSWLQPYKEESKRVISNDQVIISHKEQHHPSSEMTLNFSSASPSSSSISSYNQHHNWREHKFWASETNSEEFDRDSRLYLPFTNPKSNPNSASSSDIMEMVHVNKFKELNAENLKTLCNTLERKVPWQSDIIPEIASTILQVRSGMVRRNERSRLFGTKEETWLFFLGADTNGKEKIARELASLIFGCSRTNFVSIGLTNFSSNKSGSTDDLRNKRSRLESSHNYLERFIDAISVNPHRVILMEEMEKLDSYSQMGIKDAMERGRIRSSNGDELSICDAIIIFDSRSRACYPSVEQKSESEEVLDEKSLDLNLSAMDEVGMDACSFDDNGILELVDRAFFFKSAEDL